MALCESTAAGAVVYHGVCVQCGLDQFSLDEPVCALCGSELERMDFAEP